MPDDPTPNPTLDPAPAIEKPDDPSMADIGGKIADAGVPDPEPTLDPTPEPTPETYSKEQYDEVQAQVTAYNTMASLLKEAGVTSVDSLKQRLTAPTTESIKELFKGALGQKDPAEPVTPAAVPGTMTPEAVSAIVRQALAESEQARTDHAYQEAVVSEASLKAKIIGDPRFAAIVQKASFDQAWEGKKGGAAKTLAVLADHLLYERGLKSPDGTYRPVTDPAAVSEVTDTLAALFNELKAVTLHQISQDSPGIEAPDPLSAEGVAPTGIDPTPDDMLSSLWDDDSLMEGDAEAAKRSEAAKRAIAATFEKSYRQAAAAGGQLPLSQLE